MAVDRDVAELAAVGLDAFLVADEHAPGVAAGVIDSPPIGFQYLDQHMHDQDRGIEVPAPLAFRSGKAPEEILLDPPEEVSRLLLRLAHRNARDGEHVPRSCGVATSGRRGDRSRALCNLIDPQMEILEAYSRQEPCRPPLPLASAPHMPCYRQLGTIVAGCQYYELRLATDGKSTRVQCAHALHIDRMAGCLLRARRSYFPHATGILFYRKQRDV